MLFLASLALHLNLKSSREGVAISCGRLRAVVDHIKTKSGIHPTKEGERCRFKQEEQGATCPGRYNQVP